MISGFDIGRDFLLVIGNEADKKSRQKPGGIGNIGG